MYSEGKAVVHLVDISPTSEPQKPDSGVVHHVAFVSRGFDGMKQRLTSKGMKFDSRQVPGGDLWQIFVHDPNGVMIELNYEAAAEQGLPPRRWLTISASSSLLAVSALMGHPQALSVI